MKLKLLFASLMLALASIFALPNTSAQAAVKTDITTQQSEAAQPLEMQRRGGFRRGGGFRGRGYGRRHFAPRRFYRPRPYYGFYGPRPVMCRTYIVYDAWGFARRVRRCR